MILVLSFSEKNNILMKEYEGYNFWDLNMRFKVIKWSWFKKILFR